MENTDKDQTVYVKKLTLQMMPREVPDRPRPQNWSLWSLNRHSTGIPRNTHKEEKLSDLKYVNNTKEESHELNLRMPPFCRKTKLS